MNYWKVVLATAVIFGAGVITGGLLVRHASPARPARGIHGGVSPRQSQPISAGGVRLEFLKRMERELDLTPDQRERIDKVLSSSQDRTKKMIREELQSARAEFREVLTEDQRKRFDESLKQQQQQSRDRRNPTAGDRKDPGVSAN